MSNDVLMMCIYEMLNEVNNDMILDDELNERDIKWWVIMRYLMMCNDEIFKDV